MKTDIRFIYWLILFSVLVFLTGYLLFNTLLKDYFLDVFYLFVFYFMLLTLAGRFIISKSEPGKPSSFNTRYFLVRWVKVLIHLILIIVYALNNRENVLSFVLVFMACYIMYSVFDIYSLNFYLKKSN